MGILSVNRDPKKIITKQAKKEFLSTKIRDGSYSELQTSISDALKKGKMSIKERRLDAEQELLYLQLHDFGQFVGIRLGIYTYALAVLAIVISSDYLVQAFSIPHPEYWIVGAVIFGCVIVLSLRRTEDYQKERIIYLKFLLDCIGLVEHKSVK